MQGRHHRLGRRVLPLLGLAAFAAACAGPAPDNLLFFSLDTTRRDHLSAYGYERDTSPRLARLAERGAVFDTGISQWPITGPSHTSMFTGLYPQTHGVGENTGQTTRDEFPFLGEILAGAGFATGGFVGGMPLKPHLTDVDRGFATYNADFPRQRRDCREVAADAVAWLGARRPDERWFLFIHFYDAHGPFHPPPDYLERFRSPEPGRRLRFVPKYQRISTPEGGKHSHLNEYVDRYDAKLRYQDDCMGEILDAVDLDRTLVAVVADHGETLADREARYNLNHGTGVWEEQIGIPYVLTGPGVAPGRYGFPVETVDLLPTLLELLAVARPAGMRVEGESLVPRMTGGGDPGQRPRAFATSRLRFQPPGRDYELPRRGLVHTIRTERWKLIVYEGVERDYVELYDLAEDPGETTEVGELHPQRRDALYQAFKDWRRGEALAESQAELSEEDLESLRALGYID